MVQGVPCADNSVRRPTVTMIAVTSNGKSVTQARFRSGTVEQVPWHHMSMMIDGLAQVAAAALPGRTGSCPARACLPARVRSFSSSGAALTSRQRTAIIIAHRLAQRRCRTMTWGAAASRPQPQRLLPASEAVVCIPTTHCGNSDRLYQS